MGTAATITVLHEERATARAMVETAFAEIERLERILSRQQYGTAVHRLNQFGRLPEPPAELVTILDHARHYSLLTEGAFDITVAPLIDLYAMRFVVAGRPPSESEIRVLRERISWKSVTVDGRGVTFEEKGTAISVDGIAKGFVVDRTCTVLAAAGADQVLVGAGGDIAAGSAESWRVAVRDPHDAARDVGIVRLCGNGIASSGDYMQAYTPDRAHHHIVDPRTGRSPEATSGVTVIAPTAMDADVISTSAFVLGPREGIALLRTLPDAEGMIVSKSGETVTSEGFASFAD
jgi:thiamine biosynthesis lipoprotein